MLLLRFKDYQEYLSPKGPTFAFMFPWILVLLGQTFPLCDVIVDTPSPFYFVILGNLLTALLTPFLIQCLFPQPLNEDLKVLKGVELPVNFLLFFYFLVQTFQIIYFKGFPLLWLLFGMKGSYFDFGIQSLNGLLNAIFLLATTGVFLIYLEKGKKRDLFKLFFLITMPVLLICRQLLMSLFFQLICLSFFYVKKAFQKTVVVALLLLTSFVILGNMRTGVTEITKILGPKSFVPESLYSLLWVYAYVVTPFNNINAVCLDVEPLGKPLYELSSLLPSVLRQNFDLDPSETGFFLVHKKLTVSTFYFPTLLDFGMVYSFFFMWAFQIVTMFSFRRAKRGEVKDVIVYAVLYMVMCLSIFANLFLFLPVIFQLVLIHMPFKQKFFLSKPLYHFSSNLRH